MILYAIRSKKSGRYFKWIEYCEDGFGAFEDNVYSNFKPDDLPTFFSQYEKDHLNQPLKDHTIEEVEFVKFELKELKE